MEFREVVARRRMVRNFDQRPLDPAAVDRLLAAGLRAPSAGFTQATSFLVLSGPVETARFWNATFPEPAARAAFRWQGLFDAPLLVVPLSHRDAYLDRYAEPDKGWVDRDEGRWPVPYWDVDAGMAAMLVMLAAVDEGLGALFFGIFPPHLDRFRAAFGVPVDRTPVGAIAVGHPLADEASRSLSRGRRPPEELIHRGRWRAVPG